jgi:CDP-diacylglycerol---serine O-phosphatidyltransferase
VKRRDLRRGVYIVPTSLTILNIFFGFVAILFAMRGMQASTLGFTAQATSFFQLASWSLALAAIFDTFDGAVARMMNATSEFGKEYDSIADVVTFGAAPAVLVYAWGLQLWGRLGGGIAFLFLVAGSLRLARFNISASKGDHRYFVGLPIPAGALTLAAIINFAPEPLTDRRYATVMLFITAGLAFAMISTLRYRSQKSAALQKERSFLYLLLLALILVVMFLWPAQFFLVFFLGYVLSGPVMKLWGMIFRRRGSRTTEEEPQPAPDQS